VRIALLAPLVTAIREPQAHGVAALLVDLATGLQAAGHDVDLFAASGSLVPGVRVVDTGVRPEDLTESWFRPCEPRSPAGVAAAARAFDRAWDLIAGGNYDVVHGHAFDVPAIEGGRRVGCPVVHTLHVPYDPAVAACLRAAAGWKRPPLVVAISESQRAGWAEHVRVDALGRGCPWSGSGGPRSMGGRCCSPAG